jgi:hydrogenase maturation protease
VRVRVIGVGSAARGDDAGLRVARALATGPLPAHVAVACCERPLPDLLDALEGVDAVILVDAMRSGAAPGSVRRLAREELASRPATSSHGFGVARALDLAEALRGGLPRLAILGIETPEAATGGAEAAGLPERGAAGADGIGAACAAVRAELAALAAEGG